MKASEIVGSFVSGLQYERIPPPVILEAKKAMLDCIGVSIAATREPALTILRSFIKRMGGGKQFSALMCTKVRTSPLFSALYNGTMAHALDFDDGAGLHIPLHPSVPVLPAVLALGEFVAADGKQILEAYIGGTEVECKLAKGCTRDAYDLGWHATGIFGTMGAAAGAAKVLGLDVKQIANALGIALSLAGGSRQNFGTMVKPLHAGVAAMNGVLSASLALDGYIASEDALEGPTGFGALFGGKDLLKQCNTLGNPYHIASGFSIKKYPSCYGTHAAIDAALQLVKIHDIDDKHIKRIFCWMDPMQAAGLPYPMPKTPLEAKFSIPFVLSVACIYGGVELKHFTDDVLKDNRVMNLCSKTNLLGENELVPPASKVSIELIDRKKYSASVDKPRGHPVDPLSMEEVETKFRSCAGIVLSENEIKKVLETILQIERLENIGSLTRILQDDFI
jgi:2-methylcitrate dehydratase PrpD